MRAAGFTAGFALCLTAVAVVSFAADETAPPQPASPAGGATPERGASLPEMLAPPLTEREEKLRALVQPRIAGDAQGAVARRTWRYVSATDAVMLGLKKNLSIRLAGRQPLLVEAALLEARAVFDPVVQVTVSQSETNQFGRSMTGQITRMTFVQGACQGIITSPTAATNNKPDVTQICFSVPGSSTTLNGPIRAAPDPDSQPGINRVKTATVDVTQQLPWGPVLRLSESTTYNKSFYSVGGQSYTYEAPWASSVFAQLSLPLPGTKGFGEFAPGDYAIKLVEKSTERAFWDVKSVINSILLQIDLAYWDLVESAESLAATTENRKLVESLAPSFERLFKQEVISQFDKSQGDAELARARVEEELALRNYYTVSTTLSALIEDDPAKIADQILFPAGFSVPGAEFPQPRLDDIQQMSLSHRPELMSRKVDSELSKMGARFAEQGIKPDVSANLSGTYSQSASTYGYKTLSQSFNHLGQPDSKSFSRSLTYVNPVGRRAAHAALSTANTNVTASEYAARITANDVIREANDAYAAYFSSVSRVQEAQEALKLSEFAYQLVDRKFHIGEFVSQVELNRNRRDVLAARLAVINAQIDVRRAQSRLLGAQGVIADRYPGMRAFNDFERHRIATLGANKALKFFLTDAIARAAEQQ
ncbi:MAG: TolC family protein [Betaproteobacteria bacterium]|nr:TolC family protein [Betaproteobacteria bacterium]